MHARIILSLFSLIYFNLIYITKKKYKRIGITKSRNNPNENIANKNNAQKVEHKISICKLRCWVSFSITTNTLSRERACCFTQISWLELELVSCCQPLLGLIALPHESCLTTLVFQSSSQVAMFLLNLSLFINLVLVKFLKGLV